MVITGVHAKWMMEKEEKKAQTKWYVIYVVATLDAILLLSRLICVVGTEGGSYYHCRRVTGRNCIDGRIGDFVDTIDT